MVDVSGITSKAGDPQAEFVSLTLAPGPALGQPRRSVAAASLAANRSALIEGPSSCRDCRALASSAPADDDAHDTSFAGEQKRISVQFHQFFELFIQ
ncbi:hypothetical protein [uncultured Variovorax sp.]|uniref:hypothetical protein n=1 Tax=uncultured Variovorax sp. TaxID=114708 RepID=UPI0025FB4A21|nr:hypothetical protein [uncultured Variovorax sp.]